MNEHLPTPLREALNGSFRQPSRIDADPSPIIVGRSSRESSNDACIEHAITHKRSGTGVSDWACVICKPCNFIGPRRYEYDGSMMKKLDGDAAAHVNASRVTRNG